MSLESTLFEDTPLASRQTCDAGPRAEIQMAGVAFRPSILGLMWLIRSEPYELCKSDVFMSGVHIHETPPQLPCEAHVDNMINYLDVTNFFANSPSCAAMTALYLRSR